MWCVHVFLCHHCEYMHFFTDFFLAGRQVLFSPMFLMGSRRPFIMALPGTSPMKTGCHFMDFHRTRLDLMQLFLYIFASLFKDDSWALVKILGGGRRKKEIKLFEVNVKIVTTINVIWAVRSDKHLTEQTHRFEKNHTNAALPYALYHSP